jgi:hypothetical protein
MKLLIMSCDTTFHRTLYRGRTQIDYQSILDPIALKQLFPRMGRPKPQESGLWLPRFVVGTVLRHRCQFSLFIQLNLT